MNVRQYIHCNQVSAYLSVLNSTEHVYCSLKTVNLRDSNFQSLEVALRYRDPQLPCDRKLL